ncbi:MAG: hypothetical protein GTO63_23875 [Anaerolineae bacterium]|nr:hypothetical protein [Anaerolineae bacterium]NIN97759.1 hypothetical protein [Anaerolineae bacterium]NIQ80749.1 hypothetical protein [Anaerolineae bacterium]
MRSKALKAFNRSLLLLLMLVTLKRDSLHPAGSFEYRTDPFTGSHKFDWSNYELQTILAKLTSRITGTDQPHGLSEEEQVQQVREYFSLVDEIGRLESEIMMAESKDDPTSQISALQADLDAKREQRLRLENLVENIILRQVEEVLLYEGITLPVPLLGRQLMPPVQFEFQSSPDFLIISRRDKIDRIGSVSLQPNLSPAQMEEIERSTDDFGVSSIIVPTGGVGAYPTVITEQTSLDFAIRAVIHEWTHNYLFFFPLGQRYGQSQELTSMNETVATMVEEEAALELARRFYPDIHERWMAERSREPVAPAAQAHEDEFSFNANMRKTRLRVEEFLAAGKVEEAEAYMEQRRQKLVEMGHYVRKLNQAYFAFYGSYAAGKGWAAETNPIGEQMRVLRERSPSLAAFLATVARMSSYQDLLDELATHWQAEGLDIATLVTILPWRSPSPSVPE